MMQQKRWSVSELTQYIREMFEMDSHLKQVEVVGEVSNLRVPRSGHAYFTLKDSDAALRCVMWANIKKNAYDFQDGERIVARGSMSVYERDGQYQLYCRQVMPLGMGDLYAQFEALKKRLQEEGLFDPDAKRPLPDYPMVVGVVTSPSTAALQDVLNVLKRRNPMIRAMLSGASVQGSGAPPQIIDALGRLEKIHARLPLDAILMVRGGGSIEDLWCFNDETLAREIARLAEYIPIVSGVGHEIDFTLADFSASVRAPTPSAAAEIVTPLSADDQRARLAILQSRMAAAFARSVSEGRQQLDWAARQLERLSPQSLIDNERQRLDSLLDRAQRAAATRITMQRARFDRFASALHAVSPGATLKRGYAIVYDSQGEVVKRATDVAAGDPIQIKVADGSIDATIIDKDEA